MSNPESFDDLAGAVDKQTMAILLEGFGEFQSDLYRSLTKQIDFTVRLEIHGNKGEVLHCKAHKDNFYRPHGVEKRIEKK